jgi:hypothetical protein
MLYTRPQNTEIPNYVWTDNPHFVNVRGVAKRIKNGGEWGCSISFADNISGGGGVFATFPVVFRNFYSNIFYIYNYFLFPAT